MLEWKRRKPLGFATVVRRLRGSYRAASEGWHAPDAEGGDGVLTGGGTRCDIAALGAGQGFDTGRRAVKGQAEKEARAVCGHFAPLSCSGAGAARARMDPRAVAKQRSGRVVQEEGEEGTGAADQWGLGALVGPVCTAGPGEVLWPAEGQSGWCGAGR